jgi:hypothetical protein
LTTSNYGVRVHLPLFVPFYDYIPFPTLLLSHFSGVQSTAQGNHHFNYNIKLQSETPIGNQNKRGAITINVANLPSKIDEDDV